MDGESRETKLVLSASESAASRLLGPQLNRIHTCSDIRRSLKWTVAPENWQRSLITETDTEGQNTLIRVFMVFLDALSHNSTLRNMKLRHLNLNETNINALVDVLLSRQTMVEVLGLGYNWLGTPAACAALGKLITAGLRELYVPSCHVDHLGLVSLVEALNHEDEGKTDGAKCRLECLILSENMLEDQGVVHLSRMLCHNKSIKHLDLTKNKFRFAGAQELARALETNQTLRTLNVTMNLFGELGSVYILGGLQRNSTLTKLNLNANLIGIQGAAALATLLGESKTCALTTLGLCACGIPEGGLLTIVRSLAKNTTLSDLNLSWNKLTPSVMKALASVMPHCRLVSLNLSNATWMDSCGEQLGGVIRNSKTLQTLVLHMNGISCATVKEFAPAFKQNATLKSINLKTNHIKKQGCIALADALLHNDTLSVLNLSDNDITSGGIRALTALLKTNTRLIDVGKFYYQFPASVAADGKESNQSAEANAAVIDGDSKAAALNPVVETADTEQIAMFPEIKEHEEAPPPGLLGPLKRSLSMIWNRNGESNDALVSEDAERNLADENGQTMMTYLMRNIKLVPQVRKTAVCMGLHSRLGANSALYNVFYRSVLGDVQLLNEIFAYAF